MKTISAILLFVLLAACSHTDKNKSKNQYNPVVSFTEQSKAFEAKVQVPKTFTDRLPLVVLVHEWWGRTPFVLEQAQKLQHEGYATLIVDLYGDSKTVETPSEAQALATPFYQNPQIGIERLTKYINLAKKDPHVDSSKIFVIGYCFGGTQALNYARSGGEVRGVVSFHGGLATTVQAKNIHARILALNGLADSFVGAKERAAFEKEMKSSKADYKIVNYKGAKHAFTNPNSTEIGKKHKIPVAYNKNAAESSWKELLIFLKK